jgi:hypothetical protein
MCNNQPNFKKIQILIQIKSIFEKINGVKEIVVNGNGEKDISIKGNISLLKIFIHLLLNGHKFKKMSWGWKFYMNVYFFDTLSKKKIWQSIIIKKNNTSGSWYQIKICLI